MDRVETARLADRGGAGVAFVEAFCLLLAVDIITTLAWKSLARSLSSHQVYQTCLRCGRQKVSMSTATRIREIRKCVMKVNPGHEDDFQV